MVRLCIRLTKADLDLPCLPPAARRVHIVPVLQTASLLSMGQLCDAGCEVIFDATNVTIRRNNAPLLTGKRSPQTGLVWHLNLDAHPSVATTLPLFLLHHSFAAVAVTTPDDLVAFTHATLFSPALSTLKVALERGFLPDFQGLTAKTLNQIPTIVSAHDDQRPSRPIPKESTFDKTPICAPCLGQRRRSNACNFPISDPNNNRTHHCFAAVFEPAAGQIHTDQTGRFVIASNTGNNYILVLYDYDSNSVLVEPMLNRTSACILAAFTVLHTRLVAAGLRPQLQRLDNECSAALKTFLTKEAIDYQLVPPDYIDATLPSTFKNHFIAKLCSVDKNFPLHLWDKLLAQAEKQ